MSVATVDIVRLDSGNADLLDQVDDVFDEAIVPERVAAYVAQLNHIMMVAVAEGRVIGQVLAVVHRHPDKATELYVDDLAVAPSFQRQGIATRLLEEVTALGRQQGCDEIWVGTEPDNEPAKCFYLSLGLAVRTALIFEVEL